MPTVCDFVNEVYNSKKDICDNFSSSELAAMFSNSAGKQ